MGNDDSLSRFLETYPTKQLQCSKFKYFSRRRVFWSNPQSINDADADVDGVIHDKIKSAFSDIELSPLKGILQFWAPIKATHNGRRVLSTSDQPFTFAYLNSGRRKYRLTCINYQYSLDNKSTNDDPMIISGPPATAFLNCFPVVFDLTLQQEDNPLVRSALECDLTTSLLVPVFYRSCCVGVVECSVKPSGLIIFNYLKHALEKVGLSTYHVHESHPSKNISGLGRATSEIEEAFKIVVDLHDLTIAQVWIPFENGNRFSLEDTQTKLAFAVKLIGHRDFSDDNRSSVIKDYYDTCEMLPLKLGEGLAGKALQTYEPYFCRNVSKMSHNGLLGLLSADTKCSCLTICLRSIYTGDLDYAFEFLWPSYRIFSLVLDSLLSKLKSCLPSFKFASGAELGDELRVLDVENSTGSGTGYFKILEGNRAANQGPNLGIYDEDETYEDNDDDDDVFIIASFEEINRLFKFSSSSPLANVTEEIHEIFNLDPGTCKLEFKFDEGKWKRLNNDDDFASCVEVWRSSQMNPVHVRMLPCTLSKCRYAGQQMVDK